MNLKIQIESILKKCFNISYKTITRTIYKTRNEFFSDIYRTGWNNNMKQEI